MTDVLDDIIVIIQALDENTNHYYRLMAELEQDRSMSLNTATCPVHLRAYQPGRPKYFIAKSAIESMMLLGYKYEEMARVLGVSVRTLRRHRHDLGLPVGQNYSLLSDEELDAIVTSILRVRFHPCLHKSLKHTV